MRIKLSPAQQKRNQTLLELTHQVVQFREGASESDLLWLGFELMKLGHLTCEIVHRKPEPVEPTEAKIGSEDKIDVMAERFERGEGLYHSEDCVLISDDQQPTENDERW